MERGSVFGLAQESWLAFLLEEDWWRGGELSAAQLGTWHK